MDQLDTPIWRQDMAELPGFGLELHRQKWSLGVDEDSIYLLGNSTAKGRSHLLFHFNLQGEIVSTKLLDGFLFQRRMQSTPYGLFIAFYDRIIVLDKATFNTLAVWNHPAPTRLDMNRDLTGEILDMKIDNQEIIALEFRESPWPGDGIPDKISGAISSVRLSSKPLMLETGPKLATVDATYSYKDFYRNIFVRGVPEKLAIANDHTLAVAMINDSRQWILCEISRDPPSVLVSFFGSSCNEIEQASGLDAHEARLSLAAIPGGGYLWGVPSMNEVILGIHTEETSVRKVDIEEGNATAVRLAVNEDSIFALVDVTVQSEAGASHFIELHKMPLSPAGIR